MLGKLYKRKLDLQKLLLKKSHFLFGPRSTGKTTLVEQQLQDIRFYNLLEDNVFIRLSREPNLIEQENKVEGKNIVIDEIQKLPKLLDEVHLLIKKYNWKFLLTGSSARKLKKGGVNLLGGRAWEAHLFPLTFFEIDQFNLLQYLNRGGLPHIYDSSEFAHELQNYVNLYLREEIISESLVKKHEYFMNFLDIIALTNGNELNFETIGKDAGVPPRTVQNYLQILEDTLLAYQVRPFKKTTHRKSISKSKVYLFDIGVVNYLAKRGEIKSDSETFGFTFEHFIMNEIRAYLSYSAFDLKTVGPFYWRTVDKYEVDCLIDNKVAIEIKATRSVRKDHCKGLEALMVEKIFKKYIVVSNDPAARILDNGILVLPWQEFLSQLWAGAIY